LEMRTLPQVTLDITEPAEPARLDLAKAARLRAALGAGGEELFGLLRDPDPDLIRCALKNPHLSEEHLLALLKRRNLPEQLIRGIHRVPLFAGSRRLRIALAGHPNAPGAILAALLPQLFLFELVTVMQLPGASPDQKLAAERAILKRLPETEIGSKITLARRGSPALLEALLREGEPRLCAAVLANPGLKESGVLSFLNSPAATAETISAVARHPRWGSRPNLRYAMLRNRKTPAVWFTLFLPTLGLSELKNLLGSKRLAAEQLAAVQQELGKRGASSRQSPPQLR
jgi:hypothetical protein